VREYPSDIFFHLIALKLIIILWLKSILMNIFFFLSLEINNFLPFFFSQINNSKIRKIKFHDQIMLYYIYYANLSIVNIIGINKY
jgi:hypothetical protein